MKIPLPKTPKGRAIRTIDWFLNGNLLNWNYDKANLFVIVPLKAIVKARTDRRKYRDRN